MNIVVCAKQVPNPEIPMGKFKIDAQALKVIPPEGIAPVISPFDEQAIEVALRIKEKNPGSKITALTVGAGSAGDILKHALSMGADEGIFLSDPAFEGSDAFGTAYILSKAIQKLGNVDLILCGRQAADWDVGQVGTLLAEDLGIPLITIARKVEVLNGKLSVERALIDGYEVLEAPMPSLVTVSNEVGLPRLPTGMGIIMAARKKVAVWKAQDMGIDVAKVGKNAARSEMVKLYIPVREAKCEMFQADTVAEATVKMAVRLREAKVI
ncbi:MAG: electron transfer flavoprotein subunit beta/FixA family protein [Dehalococcoidia bacterium]|nr:electron transfer flavoprotein subunit beta/FixA family protein [Dehalococcoidia bacterium]